jgi:hypothetical protein
MRLLGCMRLSSRLDGATLANGSTIGDGGTTVRLWQISEPLQHTRHFDFAITTERLSGHAKPSRGRWRP